MSSEKNKISIIVAGPVLPGTISTAMAKCGKPTCRCHKDTRHLHGPYYRWTGFVNGKKTTITLTKEEALECKRRIKNWKRLQEKVTLISEKAFVKAPWNLRQKD